MSYVQTFYNFTFMSEMNMNPDELDEKFKEMKKIMDEIAKKQMQSPWMSQLSWSHGTTARNMSPSATDAHYPYQEPERDEQGTFYGYKILWFHVEGMFFISPRYQVQWGSNGCLVSDVEPRENHMHGIHFVKHPGHPNLMEYIFDEWSIGRYSPARFESMLVKCALSGTVVETDQGFRAQHAQIIGVLIDGYWKSYQDLGRYSAAYPHRNPYEDDYRRAYYGDWNPNP